MAELNGGRISAVFAADSELDVRTRGSSQIRRNFYELADTCLIQLCERIVLVNFLFVIRSEEGARVIAAEAERHLRQVVRTEAEEFRFLRNLIGSQRGPRDFDHRTDLIMEIDLLIGNDFIRRRRHDAFYVSELFDLSDEWDHDFRYNVPLGMALLYVDSGFNDGRRLHFCNFRIRNGKAAASVAHHRVKFMKGSNNGFQLRNLKAHFRSQRYDILFRRRQEFMQRRIQEADRNRSALHRLVKRLEIASLHREQLIQRGFSLFRRFGYDHFPHGGDPVRIEEHMLRTTKTNSLGAELNGLGGVLWSVGVCSNFKPSNMVGPRHKLGEISRY